MNFSLSSISFLAHSYNLHENEAKYISEIAKIGTAFHMLLNYKILRILTGNMSENPSRIGSCEGSANVLSEILFDT